jgi:hypothetical protein
MQRVEPFLVGHHITIDDVVLFNNNNVHSIGKIVGLKNNNEVSVVMFMEVTAKVLVRYSLYIVTKAEAPFVCYQSGSGRATTERNSCWPSGRARGFNPQSRGFISHPVDQYICTGNTQSLWDRVVG